MVGEWLSKLDPIHVTLFKGMFHHFENVLIVLVDFQRGNLVVVYFPQDMIHALDHSKKGVTLEVLLEAIVAAMVKNR